MNSNQSKFKWFMWEGVAGSSWFMWGVSSFLSYWGLTHLAPNLPQWMKDVAIGFSVVINFVEFMIDQKGWRELLHPKTFGDIVLRLSGLACYAYDILTNVEGFIAIVFAAYGATQIAQAWQIDPILTVLAITFGFCFAAGPEPLYLEYLGSKFKYPGTHPALAMLNWVRRTKYGTQTKNPMNPQSQFQSYGLPSQDVQGNNAKAWQSYVERHPEKFKNIKK